MLKRAFICLLFVLTLLPILNTHAQGDLDNLCFTRWECDSEQDWIAGWYWAKVETGEITGSDIPAPYNDAAYATLFDPNYSPTPMDNTCYEPNANCDSVWAWQAGWYLARFLDGRITRAQFPQTFASVLPPPPPGSPAITGPSIVRCNLWIGGIRELCLFSDGTVGAYEVPGGGVVVPPILPFDAADATDANNQCPNGWFNAAVVGVTSPNIPVICIP